MKVKGTITRTEQTTVDIDPKEVIQTLFVKWRQSLPDGNKIERINLRTSAWVYEEGDYHSGWDVNVRDATPEELEKYKAFQFIKGLVK